MSIFELVSIVHSIIQLLGIDIAWITRVLTPSSLVLLFKACLIGCQILVYGFPCRKLTACVLKIASLVAELIPANQITVIPYYPLAEIHELVQTHSRNTRILGTTNFVRKSELLAFLSNSDHPCLIAPC